MIFFLRRGDFPRGAQRIIRLLHTHTKKNKKQDTIPTNNVTSKKDTPNHTHNNHYHHTPVRYRVARQVIIIRNNCVQSNNNNNNTARCRQTTTTRNNQRGWDSQKRTKKEAHKEEQKKVEATVELCLGCRKFFPKSRMKICNGCIAVVYCSKHKVLLIGLVTDHLLILHKKGEKNQQKLTMYNAKITTTQRRRSQ